MEFDIYKKDVIRHELGHWLAAKKLGFCVGDIGITIHENFSGFGYAGTANILPCHKIDDIEDLKNYLRNRIAILFSGVLSQVMIKDEAEISSRLVEKLLASDGADDNSKIIELTHILRGVLYSDNMSSEMEIQQRSEIMSSCWELACSNLEEYKDLIDFLLNEIGKCVTQSNKLYKFSRSQIENWITTYKVLIGHPC